MAKNPKPSFALVLLKSRLCQRVAAAVFASIIIVEALILILSYHSYERDLLVRLDDVERTALISGFLLQAHGSPRNLLITGRILSQHTNLRGATLYSADGALIGSFGEKPRLNPEKSRTDNVTRQIVDDRTRFEVVWDPEDTSLPFTVVGRLDATWISAELQRFVWRGIGLVLLISLFACPITMIIVGNLTLVPLLKMRSSLNHAAADPEHADQYSLQARWSREINEAILALNSLLHRVSKTHREELAMFSAMVRDAHEALMVQDHTGRLIYANAACLKLCGFPDIRSMALSGLPRFVLESSDEPISLKRYLADGNFVTEATLIGAGSRRIACELSGIRLVDETANEPVRYVAHVVDISARKEAENALRKGEEQLRLITDNLPVIIAYVDTKQRYRFVNKTFLAWYDRSYDEVIGTSIKSLLGDERYQSMRPEIEKVLRGKTQSLCQSATYPDGNKREIETSLIPHIGRDGKVHGAFVLSADVSERNATQKQLHQTQKMEALGQLTGGVAHDFNNILAIVLGNLELTEEKLKTGEDAGPLLANAVRATRRGAGLTQRLLAYSRQQVLAPTVVNLGKLVADMAALLRGTLGAHIEIETVGADDSCLCEADPSQVENAVLNFAINARDAMAKGGKLTIETVNVYLDDDCAAAEADIMPGDYVMLSITDTGTGMPPDVLERIFEPFYTTKEVGEGNGLGLSMVYGFVKQSGGHMTVDSEVGEGTVFKIYLPRSEKSEPHKVGDGARCREPVAGEETVLVVEDDPDLRILAAALLNSLGYQVMDAESGAAALELLKQGRHFDLLLTDVILPGGMSGLELVEEIQREKPGTKVLFMSGYTEMAMANGVRLDETEAFLQKPFRKQDLAAKVREILDTAA